MGLWVLGLIAMGLPAYILWAALEILLLPFDLAYAYIIQPLIDFFGNIFMQYFCKAIKIKIYA